MRIIKKGATDQIIYLDILDSASTTGGRKTGIAYNASGLLAYYTRAGAAAAQITLATQTAAGAHSDGGWVQVDATNAPGIYRLDLPDAVCATGVDSVIVTVCGASGMVEASVEIQLSAVDFQTSTNMGLSALPTANPAASNGLPTVGTGSGQISPTSGAAVFVANTGTATGGAVNTITLASGASAVDSFYKGMMVLILSGTGAGQARMISAYTGATRYATVFINFATAPDATSVYVVLPLGNEQAAYNVWEEGINSHTSGYTMGDTVRQLNTGTLIADKVWGATTRTLSAGAIVAATFAAGALGAVWSVAARTLTAFGFTVATNSDSNVTAIKAKTDNLPASPAAVGSAMTLADDAITAAKFDEVTAFPLKAADASSTILARAGDAMALTSGERTTMTAAIWNALTSGMSTVGSIGKKLADATFGGGISAADVWTYATRTLTEKTGFELVAAYDAAKSAASAANLAIVDGIVDDILADTAAIDGRLPSDPADESLLEAAIGTRASQSSVDTVYSTLTPKAAESSVAALAIIANAIQAKTDNLPASPAAVGSAMTLSSGERSTLVDLVWDELLAGHTTANSAGKVLSDVGTITPTQVADAVWGALRASYTGSGTFGEYLTANVTRINGTATIDGLALTNWFENILAHAQGDIVRTGNLYDYKKQDGSTSAFSFTSSAAGRS